jgi:hypothetical protein
MWGVQLDRQAQMDEKLPILQTSTHEGGNDDTEQENGRAVCEEPSPTANADVSRFPPAFLHVSHEILSLCQSPGIRRVSMSLRNYAASTMLINQLMVSFQPA